MLETKPIEDKIRIAKAMKDEFKEFDMNLPENMT